MKPSILPRVVWVKESKNGIGFKIEPNYDEVLTRPQLLTGRQPSFSCVVQNISFLRNYQLFKGANQNYCAQKPLEMKHQDTATNGHILRFCRQIQVHIYHAPCNFPCGIQNWSWILNLTLTAKVMMQSYVISTQLMGNPAVFLCSKRLFFDHLN